MRYGIFILNITQLQLHEVCYRVSLTENFQQHGCSTIIPLPNGTQTLERNVTL